MCPPSRTAGDPAHLGTRVENGNEEASKRVRNTDSASPPAEEDDDSQDPRRFADSGLTGQGAQSALEHLVERERTRVDRPGT
jgi:hypothetical protein